jgi:hypothetical protein
MALLSQQGGYLYQHRPDLFPQGFLTTEELCLWSAFYEKRSKEREAIRHG